MTINQFKNLLAFLVLMRAVDVYDLPAPDYIVEKFARYGVVGALRDDDSWQVGLHAVARAKFHTYIAQWSLHLEEMEKANERADT